LKERNEIWDELFEVQKDIYAGKYIKNTIIYIFIGFPRNEIEITLPDGAVKKGTSF
jgi:hypothetical protein